MKKIILLLSMFFCLGAKAQMTGVSLSGSIKMFDSTRLYRDSVLRHYSGADIVDLDTIRLAISGGGSYTSSNGITLSGSNFKLGGNLTENTSIGAGGYTFSLNNKVYNNTSQRLNVYTDTVNVLVNGSKFLHHFHVPSVSSVSGTYPNFFAGYKAGNSLAGKGYANTAIGTSSMESMNSDSSAASSNTAVGYQSLKPMVYGVRNVAIGTGAMSGCGAGTYGAPITANTAIGHHAYRQGVGNYNIAIGASALEDMTTSLTDIIGIGQNALKVNQGSFNIGIGYLVGYNNSTGSKNTMAGWGVGQLNTTASDNTLYGYLAGGGGIQTVGNNSLFGSSAGTLLTTGSSDVAVGKSALSSALTVNNATALGTSAMGSVTSGTGMTAVGYQAGMNATGATDATLVGRGAGISNTATETTAIGLSSFAVNTATFNVGTGAYTGGANSSGNKNTYMGWGAGQLNTIPTECVAIGYLSQGSAIGTSGYNTTVGSLSGKSLTSGNTNTFIGRSAGELVSTTTGSVFVGNNAGNTTTGGNNTIIGRTINNQSASNTNELNIAGALFGENTYSTTARLGVGTWPVDGVSFDASSQTNGIGLPHGTTVQEPGSGLVAGQVRFNDDLRVVTAYNTDNSAHVPIHKIIPVTVSTSGSGASINSKTMFTVLDATSNSITQTIPTASTAYTGWSYNYYIRGITTANTITVNFPASTDVNGVVATTYEAKNGDMIEIHCTGTAYYVTVHNSVNARSEANYNASNPTLGTESIAYFDASANGTITLPTATNGRIISLVNDAALPLALSAPVKTGMATTTTTLSVGQRMTISYDATQTTWRLVAN